MDFFAFCFKVCIGTLNILKHMACEGAVFSNIYGKVPLNLRTLLRFEIIFCGGFCVPMTNDLGSGFLVQSDGFCVCKDTTEKAAACLKLRDTVPD